LDPATIASKLNPGTAPEMIQIATPDDRIIQAKWQESYGTDIDDCKVWAKISPGANAPTPIIVYDTPPGGDEDNEDDEHKTVVTDITLEKGYAAHLMYAGGATPDGWTLESGAGGYFEDQFPVGAKAGIVANEDSNVPEITLISCTFNGGCGMPSGILALPSCNHAHGEGTISTAAVNNVPPYIELKAIRSNKIKASIPKDAVIIFDDTIPEGFTRYSSADGYYIRCGGTVGATGGNATRQFTLSGNTGQTASTQNRDVYEESGEVGPIEEHIHTFNQLSSAINNDPPYIEVILGQTDDDLEYIPEGAILMFDETPPNADWEVLDWGGKLLKGAAGYGGTGGNATESPSNVSGNTGTESMSVGWGVAAPSGGASAPHTHTLEFELEDVSTYPKCRPVIFAKARHDITSDGESTCVIQNDIGHVLSNVLYALYSDCGRHIAMRNKGDDQGELHCCFSADGGSGDDFVYHGKSTDGGKIWVVEQIDTTNVCEQVMSDLVVDKNNNIHFVWVEMDAADSSHRQIKYRKLSSSDVWESIETVSTAGDPYYQVDPCIQVKNDGETIGVTWVGYGWGDHTDGLDIAYRERTTLAWGAEERITTNATSTIYYRATTLDFDSDDYPHLVANYGTQSIWNSTNVYYWQKTAAGWQAAEQINNDAGDNNIAPTNSNVIIDSDNYIHIAYTISDASGPLDICYKKKARGGAWPAKETIVANGGTRRNQAPQIQIEGGGDIYCTYTIKYNSDNSYAIAYKTRTTSWQSEEILREETGRHFVYAQMMWSRQPFKTGIYQSQSQQYMVVIYISVPSNDYEIGNIEFYAEPTTVVGDIPDTVTTETYRTKRRGALCKTKFQNKVAPAEIS